MLNSLLFWVEVLVAFHYLAPIKCIDFTLQAEIQEFRRAHQITVAGKYIPNPIMTFEEANFPGNVRC